MAVTAAELERQTDPAPAANRSALADRTALVALLVANVFVGGLMLIFGAGGFELLVVYWCETIIIGMFALVKLAVAAIIGDPFGNPVAEVSRGGTLLLALIASMFFLGKFGSFVFGLGVWLLAAHAMLAGPGDAADPLYAAVGDLVGVVAACALMLFVSHACSFVVNYLGRREYREARFLKLLFWPYGRCVWMLVTLLAALGIAVSQDTMAHPTAFAVIVFAVKVGSDLAGHLLERRCYRS
jgi:hypothetical protein